MADGNARHAVLDVRARQRRLDPLDGCQPEQTGIPDQLPAQQALGDEAAQRMLGSPGAAVLVDGAHHPSKGVDRRHVAVHDREGLAVVGADADLEAHGAGVGVVDDATHLQAAHLAGDDAVLDGRLGATGDDRVEQGEVRRRGVRRRNQRLGDGRQQRALVDVPDLDRERERGRPPGQHAGVARREDVQ